MLIEFTEQFRKDYKKLRKENRNFGDKILELVEEVEKNRNSPLEGKGKPEKLKGKLSGCYSRRIDKKHRLIYRYEDEKVVLISCYGHYEDR